MPITADARDWSAHVCARLAWASCCITWPPMRVVSHSVCFDHARTLNTWKTIVTDTDRIRIEKNDIRAPLLVVAVHLRTRTVRGSDARGYAQSAHHWRPVNSTLTVPRFRALRHVVICHCVRGLETHSPHQTKAKAQRSKYKRNITQFCVAWCWHNYWFALSAYTYYLYLCTTQLYGHHSLYSAQRRFKQVALLSQRGRSMLRIC